MPYVELVVSMEPGVETPPLSHKVLEIYWTAGCMKCLVFDVLPEMVWYYSTKKL